MVYYIFFITSFLSIFISGISRSTILLAILFSFVSIVSGITLVIKREGRIKFPKYFFIMVFFVIILAIQTIFINDRVNPIYFTGIFAEGLFYWLIFFNLRNSSKVFIHYFSVIIIITSFFYIASKISNINFTDMTSLYFLEGMPTRHYHIGDLWAIYLILFIGPKIEKFDFKTWLILDTGILFLIISNARSAYLSVLAGFLYFISKNNIITKSNRYYFVTAALLVTSLFIFSSLHKTTFLSRPYYKQSIEMFPKYPFGIGVGNFGHISQELSKIGVGSSNLSVYTHNLYLETLTGMGIFSIVFLIFIYRLTTDIIKDKRRNAVWAAVVISMLINFMFDTTYTIPGLIWLWFMSIGIYQAGFQENLRVTNGVTLKQA